MSKIRKTFTEKSPEYVRQAFRERFTYNPDSGEITSTITDRLYQRLTKKNYRQSLYIGIDNIEYRVNYHRLCWFLYYNEVVPDDMQIDHIDNIRDNNKIINLRICNNSQNAKKQLIRSDNKTGYKGVSVSHDTNRYGKKYEYFASTISVDNSLYRIGRFKDLQKAAEFYDSAARFYFKDFSKCNFETEHLKPMNIQDLRTLKKQMKL